MLNKFVMQIHGGDETCSWTATYGFETELDKETLTLRLYDCLDKVVDFLNNEDYDMIPQVIIVEGEIIDMYRDLIYEKGSKYTYQNVDIQTLDEYFKGLLTKNNI